jgi:hypothetical protein
MVKVKAWGAFTAGAVCDNGATLLEYDLSEDQRFPEDFMFQLTSWSWKIGGDNLAPPKVK